MIAKERNIPYGFILVRFETGEHKQPAHLAHQPFGQQDDGFELYPSLAIGRYLAALRSGPEFAPTEVTSRAKFEQAASIEYARFDLIVSGIIWDRIIKQYIGETMNEERVRS